MTHSNGNIDNVQHRGVRTIRNGFPRAIFIESGIDEAGRRAGGGVDAPEHVVLIVARACQRAPAHSHHTKSGNGNSRPMFGFNDR